VSKTDASPAGSSDWVQVIADPVRLEIVRALARTPEATAAELGRSGFSSKPTLRRHLDALVSVGLLNCRPGESDGLTPGRPPLRYSLSPEVRASVRTVFGIDL
jgi:DNA-binding transcriptional ArsR family regulator